jgi:hypothetical protein
MSSIRSCKGVSVKIVCPFCTTVPNFDRGWLRFARSPCIVIGGAIRNPIRRISLNADSVPAHHLVSRVAVVATGPWKGSDVPR